jgi:hypothetical protein
MPLKISHASAEGRLPKGRSEGASAKRLKTLPLFFNSSKTSAKSLVKPQNRLNQTNHRRSGMKKTPFNQLYLKQERKTSKAPQEQISPRLTRLERRFYL